MQCHADAVARAERDKRLGYDRMAGNETKLEALSERADYDRCFEHCKSLADAAARAIAKGKISAGGKTIRETVEPSFRTESFRVVEVTRISVHYPLGHEHRRANGEIIAADLRRLDGSARSDVCRGIHSQHFVHHCIKIRE